MYGADPGVGPQELIPQLFFDMKTRFLLKMLYLRAPPVGIPSGYPLYPAIGELPPGTSELKIFSSKVYKQCRYRRARYHAP